MAHASPADQRDIAGIQYLRGLAAIMVVVFHVSYQLSRLYQLPEQHTLASGVDIFFVISGFVMIYSTRGGSKLSPSTFFAHRLARIGPLYWVATLATVVLIQVAPGLVKTAQLSLPHALLSLMFVAARNPVGATIAPLVTVGWTLNLEMLFYLVFAVSIAVGGRSPPRVTGCVVLALGALAAAGLALRPPGIAGFYANPLLLEFVFGIALGWVQLRGARRWPTWAAWLGVIAFLCLVLLPEGDLSLRCFRYGLPAALLVAAATRVDLPIWRAVHWLGDISYSLYISHFFTLSAVAQLWRKTVNGQGIGDILVFYLVGTGAAVVVGGLCWRYVEKPLTAAAKRMLTTRRSNRATATAMVS